MKPQSKVLVLIVFVAVTAFSQANTKDISVVFHDSDNWWNWAGTSVKDVFAPYTVESIHIIRTYARSQKEKEEIVKTLTSLIRSDSKFAGGLSLIGMQRDVEAIVLTKEGKMFIIRRVDRDIYSISSEEKMGHVIFINEDKKKS